MQVAPLPSPPPPPPRWRCDSFSFFLPSSSHVRECVMCVCVKSWSLTGESKERKKWGELDVGRWGFRVPHRRDSLRPIRQQLALWDGIFSAGLDCPVGCATEAPASRTSPPSPRGVSPLVLLSLLLLRGHCQQRNSQTHRCRLLVSPGGNLCCPPTCLPRDGHRCLKETKNGTASPFCDLC